VIYDEEENVYKMWFVARTRLNGEPTLGYAISADGIAWSVHPEPIYRSARGPSVIKSAQGDYSMWMCSRPSPEHHSEELYKNIYRFSSPDGINWTRGGHPALRPYDPISTCVYPFVIFDGREYVMLFGGHVAGGRFEIFHAVSDNGTEWRTVLDRPFFPASGIPGQFDGRYTSTPCVVVEPNRFLLYYSGRSLDDEYVDGEGKRRVDRSGVYSAIGVAVLTLS
jgi:hypothetical protein